MRAIVIALMGGLVGCHTWVHAPGHGERQRMTKRRFDIVTSRWCASGACDLRGPDGDVRFSEVRYELANDARSTTRFNLSYRGRRAECSGPSVSPSTREIVPFACSIGPADRSADTHRLELRAGCTRGTLAELSQAGIAGASMVVRTDVVTLLGADAPGREVSLLDGSEPLVSSDSHASGQVFFERAGATLGPEQVLAVVATHAFSDIDGTPPECLVRR